MLDIRIRWSSKPKRIEESMRTRTTTCWLALVLAGWLGGCGDNQTVLPPDAATPDAPVSPDELEGPTLSTTEELAIKRYVAAGDRAYVIGVGNGDFAPMGWHIRGEMGGVWAHPIKLLDGYWFAIDGTWLPAADKLTTGIAFAELDYPQMNGLTVTRREFSPDGWPVVLVRLTFQNSDDAARDFELTMEMRSELMGSYGWGWTTPNARDMHDEDEGAFDGGRLVFTEPARPWTAVVAAKPEPSSGAAGATFWGSVPENARPDFSEYGKGTGGQLTWDVSVPAGGEQVVWVAIAGSHTAAEAAHGAATAGLADPRGLFEEKMMARLALLDQTKVELPDQAIAAAFDWGKLNMADMRITFTDVKVRDVDEGREYPEPVTTLPELTGIGAGFPDYPWLFGTDGAYTSYPLIASGQWDTAMEHLRAIRDVSIALNGDTGKVVHEVMTDGSVYFGSNTAPGNTNETAEFAVAVDLVWRWTGDNAFRNEMLDFVTKGMQYVTSTLDEDGDGWPEGYGMVERSGMGSEKLDVTAYTWQALRALERMAAGVNPTTAQWAQDAAQAMETGFETAWWMPAEQRYADSLCNAGDEVSLEDQQDNGWTNVCTEADTQLQQRHWINAVPMEVGMAQADNAVAALQELEASSGDCGLYHTGQMGGPSEQGELKCWTLPTSVMAVGEANYGRLGEDQALFYIRVIANLVNLEMPGALPEIAPSPEYDAFGDFRERAMFLQAWSAYGVQWPVIHHMLGINPDVPAGRIVVVPQIPDSWPGLSVENLRVGTGTIAVSTSREAGGVYETTVDSALGMTLVIGHTLPAGANVASVMLDGVAVAEPTVVDTLRGREVRVETSTGAIRTLTVTTE
jgi:glycogen debranching enzyme